MTNSLIAITGGIGSGKSYVCSMLRRRGIEVYDCDSAAKRIIATSAEVRRGLTRLMGPHTFLADGRLNKAAVAEFLLQSESNAKAINDIVHPAVAADFKKSGVRWMECAILYESGFFRLALLFGKPFLFGTLLGCQTFGFSLAFFFISLFQTLFNLFACRIDNIADSSAGSFKSLGKILFFGLNI